MPAIVNPRMPALAPATVAAMQHDIAAYRTDFGLGDTDLDFEQWLKVVRPQRYETYLELQGHGPQLGTGGKR